MNYFVKVKNTAAVWSRLHKFEKDTGSTVNVGEETCYTMVCEFESHETRHKFTRHMAEVDAFPTNTLLTWETA